MVPSRSASASSTEMPRGIPNVIGHRGAASAAPENTLAGFRKAAALGCSWVECDVRLSREDRPVVFHDDILARTTDGRGPVGVTPFHDLRCYDAGSYFCPAYRGERIPTLEEALTVFQSLRLGCDLEMKAEPGRERALAEVVARTIERLWSDDITSLLVTSFSPVAMEAFAAVTPDIPRGYLTRALPLDWQARAERLRAAVVVCDHTSLGFADVRSVKAASYPLLAYTVNDVGRARELFAWGTHGVISDVPDMVLAALPKRPVRTSK
jgi:glycerophosphoryl diester phosphodiesterase